MKFMFYKITCKELLKSINSISEEEEEDDWYTF